MIEDAFRQQHLWSSLHFWTLCTITSQRTSTATQRQGHTGQEVLSLALESAPNACLSKQGQVALNCPPFRRTHRWARGCMDKERRDNVGFQSVRGQSVLGDDDVCYGIGKRLKLKMETENSGI